MKRQVSVIELFGFDDDGEHVQEFLNEKGIRRVDKHLLNKKEEK